MTDAAPTPHDSSGDTSGDTSADTPDDPAAGTPADPLPAVPSDAHRRVDDSGYLLPPLDAARTPAPPAISSSFGEEVPEDA